MARDLHPGSHAEICDQFQLRGPDSDIDLAESFEAQRTSVISILIHDLYRQLRHVRRQLATPPSPRSMDRERLNALERRMGMQATDPAVVRMVQGRVA